MKRSLTAVLAAALMTLAACGSSDSDSSDSTGASADSAFSFTDDVGTKIELDEVPDRLVVQSSMAAALTDLGLGDKIVGVFGPLRADGDAAQVAGLDIDSVEDVTGGGDYGDVDVEKVAALKPDLVVTSQYLAPDLWYVNEASATALKKLVPILVVDFDGKTLPELLDGTERAAEALGADLGSADVTASHEQFDAAATRVKEIGTELGDRTILAGSYSTDLFYVSNPQVSPDLSYWVDELGLPITVPDNPDEGGYFESLSWEKADKYPADVFLYDDRIGAAGLTSLQGEKVFGTLEAAQNDAYVPWTSVAPPSYQAYADLMNRLADDLTKLV